MASILHGNAKTTPRIRKEIQNANKSISELARIYHLTPKTISKWKAATTVEDGLSGGNRSSRSLTQEQEQIICEVRRITRFALDDILFLLKPHIQRLTRSNLYRTLKRHNLNQLPTEQSTKIKPKTAFKDYNIGYVHIDISRLMVNKDKFYLFVAIDRICKYAYIEMHKQQTAKIACEFLNNMTKDFPFKVHTVLTDNGAQFTHALFAKHKNYSKPHPFDELCRYNSIKHKLTQFRHPWTNGQVEIFNKQFKTHTTKQFHYENETELRQHAQAFILLYNHQKPLKSYRLKTPYELMVENYQKTPECFLYNPKDKRVELNN